MATGLLHAHSGLRWLILLLLVVTIIMAFVGWFGKKPFTQTNKRLLLFSTIVSDVQLLIGLVMYFFTSSITKTAFQDFGYAMKTPELRYFAVEHILVMIIAIALLHIGKVRATKQSTDEGKHKQTAIFFTISLLLMLSRIPW